MALCLALACLGPAESSRAAEKIYTNSIGMEFALIPAGSFMMGTNFEVVKYTPDLVGDGAPMHKVGISKPFYLGKYEVTQAQWEAVMGANPSKFKGNDHPVEHVSWQDAQEFIQRLNALEGHGRYRLPTEAEWEYAARAGTGGAYFFGDDAGELYKYAWYDADYFGGSTKPVGRLQPNPWGLYDIYGNVLEWVQDWYRSDYYYGSPETDPAGPETGGVKTIRGGCWFNVIECCRSAYRYGQVPEYRGNNIGLRLALSPE